MRSPLAMSALLCCSALGALAQADQALLETHCGKCLGGADPQGDFRLTSLGESPSEASLEFWLTSLDYLQAREMPPASQNRLSDPERQRLVRYLEARIRIHEEGARSSKQVQPRRLNNRELARSVSDVLMIEDVGTHQPTANLLGDTLQDGFDTHGDALGLSEFHLEQYLEAFRKIVDATILSGKRPPTRRYEIPSDKLRMTSLSNRRRAERANRTPTSIDILDIRLRAFFSNFEVVPFTGRYRISIRATGIDRGVYDAADTGHYHGDPIRLRVHLGDRTRDFELLDEEVMEIKLDEWLAEGTRIQISYPTDALRMKGNGNFKFQYRIGHDYIKKHDPDLYAQVVARIKPKRLRAKQPSHWSHWTDYWQGPRPRLFHAEVEGPIYESWPPQRQVRLLGAEPKAADVESILGPIARRAWRRDLQPGELDSIAQLVRSRSQTVGDIEALKEGIVAVLVSPSFLLINPESGESADRFATKLSYFLSSTTPSERLRSAVRRGELQTSKAVLAEVQRHLDEGTADEFLREFPYAWLQLDRINFMAPDPDRFPLHDRKRLSEDMVDEVLHFFRYAVRNNRPIPELLTADYTFLNADLAKVYGVEDVPQDSKLRKYTFRNGRRGGFLGMGAFLTLTADSMSTSPIHRAIYVMENFLGVHPDPPPADVNIEEPDIRAAQSIKEVLEAHRSDETCASCHRRIAFENFDPVGAWRDEYTEQIAPRPSRKKLLEIKRQDEHRAIAGLPPLPKPWQNKPLPIDASAEFLSGDSYQDIAEFRLIMQHDANRDRFVRCFITKLLTYANGRDPQDYSAVERILDQSAECDYRIVDTMAAVVDSELFRNN